MNNAKTKLLAIAFAGFFVASLGAPRLFTVMNGSLSLRPLKSTQPVTTSVELVPGRSKEIQLRADAQAEFAILGRESRIDYGAGAYYLAAIKEHNPRLVSEENVNNEKAKLFRVIDDLLLSRFFAITESGVLYGFETELKAGRVAKLLTKVSPELYKRISNTEYFGNVINPDKDVVASIQATEDSKANLKANWIPKEDIIIAYGENFNNQYPNTKYNFKQSLRTADKIAYKQTIDVKVKPNS